jgi:hypothetical protein
MGMKPRKKVQTCKQPDRHEPKLVCGYPMPCPHHTVLVVVQDKPRMDVLVTLENPYEELGVHD